MKSGPLLFLNTSDSSLLRPPALNRIILVSGKEETETKRLSLLNNSIPSALLSPDQMWFKCFAVVERGSSLASDHGVDGGAFT